MATHNQAWRWEGWKGEGEKVAPLADTHAPSEATVKLDAGLDRVKRLAGADLIARQTGGKKKGSTEIREGNQRLGTHTLASKLRAHPREPPVAAAAAAYRRHARGDAGDQLGQRAVVKKQSGR